MNKENKYYLVPMWNYKNHKMKDHLALIKAQDNYHAMLIAMGSHNWTPEDKEGYSTLLSEEDRWNVDMNYAAYQECEVPENTFTYMNPNAKIDIPNNMEERTYMDIYDYMYWGDYNAQIQALAEKWSFEGKNDNSILKNYLKYTFNKLQDEGKVIETDTYCVFNTGLFSHYYVPIYIYGELNKNESEDSPKWFFKGFKDKYELGNMDIENNFPERADYFSDPNRLVFNWHYEVNINYKHILDDLNTSQRLPDSIKNSDIPLETLKGVIDTAIQKVTANYKLAVPHYYQNKIQLLVPLCFGKDKNPSVALVLNLMKNGYYQATTCLSMEMAYMDARLIAKPESNWLMAENIISTEKDVVEK